MRRAGNVSRIPRTQDIQTTYINLIKWNLTFEDVHQYMYNIELHNLNTNKLHLYFSYFHFCFFSYHSKLSQTILDFACAIVYSTLFGIGKNIMYFLKLSEGL